MLAPESGGTAAAALAPLAGIAFPAHVRAVRATETELTLVLRSGLELRLGDAGDLRLKLAVARQLLLLAGRRPVRRLHRRQRSGTPGRRRRKPSSRR